MFSGLMSRWITPCPWAYSSASADLARDAEGFVERELLLRRRRARRDSPSTNGMM